VGVKAFQNLPLCPVRASEVESDNFKSVVHACDEQIVPTLGVGMPLDTPGSATCVDCGKRDLRIPSVEESDGIVVTVGRSDSMFQRQMYILTYPQLLNVQYVGCSVLRLFQRRNCQTRLKTIKNTRLDRGRTAC
jgi:hypothetical protein